MYESKLTAQQLAEEPWKKKIITPRVASTGIVESPDRKRVLLIDRKYEPYGLAWPGGMVELGETIKEAAVREVKEETGIDANIVGLLNVTSSPDQDPRWHVIIFYFIMRASKDMDPVGGDDAKKAFWVRHDDLDKYMDSMTKSSLSNLSVYKYWLRTGFPELLNVDPKI